MNYSTILRILEHPVHGILNGRSLLVIEFNTSQAGHSIVGYEMFLDTFFKPFFVGLATAVIIHIVIAIAHITPTVNGGYAK